MRCEDCRTAVSARIDGEGDGTGDGTGDGAVEEHLAGCPACRAFAERAAHITRLARLRPVHEGPDVLPALLAALDADAPTTPASVRAP